MGVVCVSITVMAVGLFSCVGVVLWVGGSVRGCGLSWMWSFDQLFCSLICILLVDLCL